MWGKSLMHLSLLLKISSTSTQAMRGTGVRSHTLAISFGSPLTIEPSLDVFNDAAYESIDFAIMAARLYGLKVLLFYILVELSLIQSPPQLLIPLVDNVWPLSSSRKIII